MTAPFPSPAPAPAPPEPLPLDDVLERLRAALAGAVADAVELVWIETLSGRAVAGGRRGARKPRHPRRLRTVEVRVEDGGRVGFHRDGGGGRGELEAALRTALAQSRLASKSPPLRLAPAEGWPEPAAPLHDPTIARLTVNAAADLLANGAGEGDRLVLDWSELRLAVVNSRGLARAVAATAVTLAASHGRAPGIGRAAGSARTLGALDAAGIAERARGRASTEPPGEPPAGALPVLLAAEAAAALVGRLAAPALSSRAFLDGTGPFAGRLGEAVADPALSLVDDGGDPAGLPFPCDLAGFATRRIALVEAGVLVTPAVDDALAAAAGLPPTPHAAGADEARPAHLFLLPGGAAPADLLAAADGGLWIGELYEAGPALPGAGGLRAVARNVRRIAGGGLGQPLPDLAWEADPAALLAGPLLVGGDPLALATPEGLGAWSAPSLALPAAGGFHTVG